LSRELRGQKRAWVLRHELAHYIFHSLSHTKKAEFLVDDIEEALAEFLALVTTLVARYVAVV